LEKPPKLTEAWSLRSLIMPKIYQECPLKAFVIVQQKLRVVNLQKFFSRKLERNTPRLMRLDCSKIFKIPYPMDVFS